MHTIKTKTGRKIHYNSDLSGDVIIEGLVVKGEDLLELLPALFRAISDNERKQLMWDYCKECGTADPRCQCWNDE